MSATDTGFYYLQSRYYDPAIGRFLNADVYTSTGQGLLGNNMFAYCRNNPVSRKDAAGTVDVETYLDDGSDGDAYNEPIDPDDVAQSAPAAYPVGQNYGGNSVNGNGGVDVGSSRGTFRKNLEKATGKSGKGNHAHHVFPRKFAEPFDKIGIKVDDIKNGAWWESRAHLENSYQYNLWWDAFFSIDGVTASDAEALADFLANLFGFTWRK